jgi:hypothetical protein
MDGMDIHKLSRDKQIALRDALTAALDDPGADPSPFVCAMAGGDSIAASLSATGNKLLLVMTFNEPAEQQILLSPQSARRFALRLAYLANQLGA